MKTSLKNILIISYSMIALLIILSLRVSFNIRADQLFEEYAKNNRKPKLIR